MNTLNSNTSFGNLSSSRTNILCEECKKTCWVIWPRMFKIKMKSNLDSNLYELTISYTVSLFKLRMKYCEDRQGKWKELKEEPIKIDQLPNGYFVCEAHNKILITKDQIKDLLFIYEIKTDYENRGLLRDQYLASIGFSKYPDISLEEAAHEYE